MDGLAQLYCSSCSAALALLYELYQLKILNVSKKQNKIMYCSERKSEEESRKTYNTYKNETEASKEY